MNSVDQIPTVLKKAELGRNFNLRFKLEKGSACVSQKLSELSVSEPTLSFRYVGRNGYDRFSQLRREAIALTFWESLSSAINVQRQQNTLLPND